MIGLIFITILLVQTPLEVPAKSGAVSQSTPSVAEGTGIPVALINRVSTKNIQAGANIYAKTVVPISDGNKIVIPPDSTVIGKVIEAKRPGRIKGKPSLTISFQTLILPGGATIPIYGSLGGSDTGVRKGEATIEGEPDNSDLEDVAVAGGRGAAGGAVVGALSQGVSVGRAAAIGGGAGAAAGLAEALIRRGDDLTLERGTIIEIILDQKLEF